MCNHMVLVSAVPCVKAQSLLVPHLLDLCELSVRSSSFGLIINVQSYGLGVCVSVGVCKQKHMEQLALATCCTPFSRKPCAFEALRRNAADAPFFCTTLGGSLTKHVPNFLAAMDGGDHHPKDCFCRGNAKGLDLAECDRIAVSHTQPTLVHAHSLDVS